MTCARMCAAGLQANAGLEALLLAHNALGARGGSPVLSPDEALCRGWRSQCGAGRAPALATQHITARACTCS